MAGRRSLLSMSGTGSSLCMPLPELWLLHLLPLLIRRQWVKTRARLRRVSRAHWAWDEAYTTPPSFRSWWEQLGGRKKKGALLFRDLAALSWPESTDFAYGGGPLLCSLDERTVAFAVEWDDDGSVMTTNDCSFEIRWQDGYWQFLEISHWDGSETLRKEIASPLERANSRALARYLHDSSSDECSLIEDCFGLCIGAIDD